MTARGSERSGRPSPLATIAADIRALDLGAKALRTFGLVIGGILLALALIAFWRNDWSVGPLAAWLGGIGGVLVVLGAAVPVALRPLYRVWMALAIALSFVMTRVVLTLAYYLVIAPIGLALRALGKDPLTKARAPEAESYWIRREAPAPSSRERLERYY